MCGIIAMVGTTPCRERLVAGLSALEYRGYDSAGVALLGYDGTLSRVRAVGDLAALREGLSATSCEGGVGIAHTRWATHGGATVENAHPHLDCSGETAVVHNGVITNHEALKAELSAAGHCFASSTDSETMAHLFGALCRQWGAERALAILNDRIQGSCASVLLSVSEPGRLFFIRKRSPLLFGQGEGRAVLASDALAFDDSVTSLASLPDNTYGWITAERAVVLRGGVDVPVVPLHITTGRGDTSLGAYRHYMLKEIFEQPAAIARTISAYKKGVRESASSSRGAQRRGDQSKDSVASAFFIPHDVVRSIRVIHIIAAGSSRHAGMLGQAFFEQYAGLQVTVSCASEFTHAVLSPASDTLYLAISQSGETADTLHALSVLTAAAERVGVPIITAALTNAAQSTLARSVPYVLAMSAGPEIAVASTKAFSAQVASLYWLAITWGAVRGIIAQEECAYYEHELERAGELLGSTLERLYSDMTFLYAPQYRHADKALFLGRGVTYPLAQEAALKLAEIAYTFTLTYPAGELKHGPLALVDSAVPVFFWAPLEGEAYAKCLINASEVRARGGRIMAFVFEGQSELAAYAENVVTLPKPADPLLAPLVMIGAAQLLAYSITVARGLAVDKPRNLAKSVTVE